MNVNENSSTTNCVQPLTKDIEIVKLLAKTLINRLTKIINSAENGEATLELVSENNNDIIMINLDLPYDDKHEITCIIKDQNTTTAENLKIPAITLTAQARSVNKKNFDNKKSLINYLFNPLDHDYLKIALKYHLFK